MNLCKNHATEPTLSHGQGFAPQSQVEFDVQRRLQKRQQEAGGEVVGHEPCPHARTNWEAADPKSLRWKAIYIIYALRRAWHAMALVGAPEESLSGYLEAHVLHGHASGVEQDGQVDQQVGEQRHP